MCDSAQIMTGAQVIRFICMQKSSIQKTQQILRNNNATGKLSTYKAISYEFKHVFAKSWVQTARRVVRHDEQATEKTSTKNEGKNEPSELIASR